MTLLPAASFVVTDPTVASDLAAGLELLDQAMNVDGGLHPASRRALTELRSLARAEEFAGTSEERRGTPNVTTGETCRTLSTVEASTILGIGPRAVRGLVQRGSLSGRVVRGAMEIDAESVQQLRREA
jgi:hypothetical protein